jgi:copper oxidase (laccase) domain-containing protein
MCDPRGLARERGEDRIAHRARAVRGDEDAAGGSRRRDRPHIGACCYEVDEPVLQAIPERSVFTPADRPGHAMLDLFALNRLRLVGAGVPARAIERMGGCTLCDPSHRYASYRRDKSKGQMLHFVRLKA